MNRKQVVDAYLAGELDTVAAIRRPVLSDAGPYSITSPGSVIILPPSPPPLTPPFIPATGPHRHDPLHSACSPHSASFAAGPLPHHPTPLPLSVYIVRIIP